jgi:hypothetical protein
MFALPYNSSASSIMFDLQLDGPLILDRTDLMALATRHKLRIDRLDQPLVVTGSRMAAAEPRRCRPPKAQRSGITWRRIAKAPDQPSAAGRSFRAASGRGPRYQARDVQAEGANECRLIRI